MKHQLSSGPAGLDAKIKKEIEANEGGIWRERKARLLEQDYLMTLCGMRFSLRSLALYCHRSLYKSTVLKEI
jgi:hypothetical protein